LVEGEGQQAMASQEPPVVQVPDAEQDADGEPAKPALQATAHVSPWREWASQSDTSAFAKVRGPQSARAQPVAAPGSGDHPEKVHAVEACDGVPRKPAAASQATLHVLPYVVPPSQVSAYPGGPTATPQSCTEQPESTVPESDHCPFSWQTAEVCEGTPS
jgi:hypothetical protein